ncbi:hypothetical protein ACJZ2D_015065 [Fusarium nematophilum]
MDSTALADTTASGDTGKVLGSVTPTIVTNPNGQESTILPPENTEIPVLTTVTDLNDPVSTILSPGGTETEFPTVTTNPDGQKSTPSSPDSIESSPAASSVITGSGELSTVFPTTDQNDISSAVPTVITDSDGQISTILPTTSENPGSTDPTIVTGPDGQESPIGSQTGIESNTVIHTVITESDGQVTTIVPPATESSPTGPTVITGPDDQVSTVGTGSETLSGTPETTGTEAAETQTTGGNSLVSSGISDSTGSNTETTAPGTTELDAMTTEPTESDTAITETTESDATSHDITAVDTTKSDVAATETTETETKSLSISQSTETRDGGDDDDDQPPSTKTNDPMTTSGNYVITPVTTTVTEPKPMDDGFVIPCSLWFFDACIGPIFGWMVIRLPGVYPPGPPSSISVPPGGGIEINTKGPLPRWPEYTTSYSVTVDATTTNTVISDVMSTCGTIYGCKVQDVDHSVTATVTSTASSPEGTLLFGKEQWPDTAKSDEDLDAAADYAQSELNKIFGTRTPRSNCYDSGQKTNYGSIEAAAKSFCHNVIDDDTQGFVRFNYRREDKKSPGHGYHFIVSFEVYEGCSWKADYDECMRYMRVPIDSCDCSAKGNKQGGWVENNCIKTKIDPNRGE